MLFLIIKMPFQLQATIDVCFRLQAFRNITNTYLRSLYFKLQVGAGTCLAVPYQIISQNKSFSSITLLDYVSPLVSLGPRSCINLQELVVFRINVPIAQLEYSHLSYKFILVRSPNSATQRVVGTLSVQYNSLLWVAGYVPVVFDDNGCGIDVTVQTQLLKFRVRELEMCPNQFFSAAIQSLSSSFHKINSRLAFRGKSQILDRLQSQTNKQLQSALMQYKAGLQISAASKLISNLGDSIQKSWAVNLRTQLSVKGIDSQQEIYFKAFSQKLRQMGQQKTQQAGQIFIQNIRQEPLPTLQLIHREQIPQKQERKAAYHFVFLVHGYGATSSTMQQFQLFLRYLYPHLTVHNSCVNQNKTEDQLEKMGERLATEMQLVIREKSRGDDYCITIIAHSLGGLIARSALTFMEEHRHHMKCFISLGTPHLGHLFHNSAFNKFGIWAFATIKRSVVMSSLLLQNPHHNYRRAYIYELSTRSGLNWFQEVAFYGSKGDRFVSLQSSLCLSNEEILSEKILSEMKAMVWEQMRGNIGLQLKGVCHSKYLVDFSANNSKLQSKNFTDDWLGRRDHMNLCMSTGFVKSLLITHRDVFRDPFL